MKTLKLSLSAKPYLIDGNIKTEVWLNNTDLEMSIDTTVEEILLDMVSMLSVPSSPEYMLPHHGAEAYDELTKLEENVKNACTKAREKIKKHLKNGENKNV